MQCDFEVFASIYQSTSNRRFSVQRCLLTTNNQSKNLVIISNLPVSTDKSPLLL